MTDPAPWRSDQDRNGKIVTFYSYKGGTGRTMALANVAWILAANGRRVLVADWDLESPGLHRFFHPFVETEVRDTPGIIDLIRDYERAAARESRNFDAERTDIDEWAADPKREAELRSRLQRLAVERGRAERYAFSLRWTFADDGCLDFLSAGRQNSDYAAALAGLDWDNFFERLCGGKFLEALRSDMKSSYDYVLIDSRTGLSDVADICTMDLPDVLVDCFTLSTQGIEGAAQVARRIQDLDVNLRILPVPMRVDSAEKEKVEAGHALAMRLFDRLPADLTDAQRREYWGAVEVPYRPFYAYEETLAVFGEAPGSPSSMLAAFERLTARITDGEIHGLPPMEESIRQSTRQLFTRKPPAETDQIILDHAAEDQVWAEWIAELLGLAGLKVADRRSDDAGRPLDDREPARVVAVASPVYISRLQADPPKEQPSLAVYVADARPVRELANAAPVSIAGMSERQVADRLLRALDVPSWPSPETITALGVRFPGSEPRIYNPAARNARFTGRNGDLRALRQELRAGGTAVVLPVTLQGLGGVGKTQLALEYAHRFKSDYDLVWWIDCGDTQFVDSRLGDLAGEMKTAFGLELPPGAQPKENAAHALTALREGRLAERWLIIFDNADEIKDVAPWLPSGRGHVLITSRNREWGERARPLTVDVFTREESVSHLRRRVETMTPAEADQVAEVLGDLPLAVATAGAWLAETGVSVPAYLARLEHKGPETLSISRISEYPSPVAKTWDLSIDQLGTLSKAAARLFQLCSMLAPDIPTELLYSPEMARVLEPLDPALSEPMIIGQLVQKINRLALIKVDTKVDRVQVHRLVQAVVRSRMTAEELESVREDVHQVLAAARPRRDVDDPDMWKRYRMLWPHLSPAEVMRSSQESARRLIIDRVRYLWQRDDLERGRRLAEEAAAVWQEMLEATEDEQLAASLHGQLLRLRFNLANILRSLARFKESRRMDEAVLAGQQELLGLEHPHTLMTYNSLAADLRALGKYREALERDKKTHTAWTEQFGENHVRTLAAAHNLGLSYRLNGQFERSLQMDERTYEIRRTMGAAEHPRTLASAAAIARGLLETGRYNEAASRMDALHEATVKALGIDSQQALIVETLRGIALRSAGRSNEAEAHFERAEESLTRRFGHEAAYTLSCRLSHSANLLALYRIPEAEAEARAVLATYERQLGADHPHALVCRVNLASMIRLREEPAEAMEVLRPAIPGLTERLRTDHPHTLAAHMVHAVLLADQGRLQESLEADKQTAEHLTAVLGKSHPDTLRCRANLLLTMREMGSGEADARRLEVIAQLAGVIGADHPTIETLEVGRRVMRALDPPPF